jgi:heterodisulfide reductase subunit B
MDETECCGNPIIGVNEEVPFQLAKEKLDHVKDAGAKALITCCPFCHMIRLKSAMHRKGIQRKIQFASASLSAASWISHGLFA